MPETTVIVLYLSRAIVLATGILFTYIFLTPKRSFWVQVIAYTATLATVSLMRILLEPFAFDPILLGYIMGTLYLVPCTLLFKETLHAKVFVFFMVFSLTQFAFLFFLHIDRFLSLPIPYTLLLLGLLLELACLPLISRYAKTPIRSIIRIIDQQHPSFTLFPMLSFTLLAFYGVQRTYLLSNFIPLVIANIVIFFSYYLITISINQTRRRQQLEKQMALQSDHYRKLTSSITTAKASRHDLRQHLVTSLEFLGKNNAAAAKEYLNRLCNHYEDSSIPTVCSNQSADALLCHYLKLAKQHDINLVTNLHLPDNLGIDDLDLCVILGNCLENAIEACRKINSNESRFIDINTTITKGHLLIKIANSFNGIVQRQDNEFFSSKSGVDHGIGLASIRELTAKHHGHCSISFDQQVFKVAISLKLAGSIA